MSAPIIVGIGEYCVQRGEGVLITYSLGSCVAIALYDPKTKIAGLAHILLSSGAANINDKSCRLPFKYANIAIPAMVHAMVEQGAEKMNMIAKIAGGACLFESAMQDPIFSVGNQNVEAVKNLLAHENIKIVAEDCGKNYGRTLEFDISTGKLSIRTLKKGLVLQI
jgi:chemotaxis protein CheD